MIYFLNLHSQFILITLLQFRNNKVYFFYTAAGQIRKAMQNSTATRWLQLKTNLFS